jgi:acyl-CoA thioesterase
MSDAKENFLASFRDQVEAQKLAQFLGLVLEEVAPGRARVSMTCGPEMANILGMVHGAALFALIDEAFQAAVNAHGTVAVALNLNLTFHQAPRMGERLTAVAREIHTGRRIISCYIEVTDPQGGLVASCQSLAYRKNQPLPFGREGGGTQEEGPTD